MINLDINGQYVNYLDYGNKKKDAIVLLHGWGQNIEMMQMLGEPFKNEYRIIIVDFPGFGLSPEPKRVMDVNDYTILIEELLKKLKVKNPILIGHSFGGKISLAYATKYKTKKLVLLASPYKQNITKPTFKMKVYKAVKKIPGLKCLESFVKKHVGSTDYRNASETMRKILVNHVNLDLTEEAKKIKCPTLLIWGTNDEAVSINDAIELEKIIPNCGLVKYEGCTHYAYLEALQQVVNILKNFI